MTLKNTYLEPRYVLLLPETRDGHERRLLEKGVYTAEQIRLTLDRAEFYAQFNGEHPGFFDTTVFSGTICSSLHAYHVFYPFNFAFLLAFPVFTNSIVTELGNSVEMSIYAQLVVQRVRRLGLRSTGREFKSYSR